MGARSEPLYSRLATLLGLQGERPASLQAPEPIALSPKGTVTLMQGSRLLEFAARLVREQEAPMAALRAALGSRAGKPPAQTPVRPVTALPPRARLMIPVVAALLEQDQRAAQLASSLMVRYDEAVAELRRLEAALANGRLDAVMVERSRGRFFFLTKLGHLTREFPVLARLFDVQAAERPKAPAVSPQPRKPPEQGGEEATVLRQALYLLECVEMKMLILQAAFDLVTSDDPSVTLPYPAHQTALQLSGFLRLNPSLLAKIREALGWYRAARELARPRPIQDLARLKAVLSSLSTLPYMFAENPILASMFPRAEDQRTPAGALSARSR